MSYFIKLEHTAHYKAKRQNTVKTNLHMCTQTPHTHTFTLICRQTSTEGLYKDLLFSLCYRAEPFSSFLIQLTPQPGYKDFLTSFFPT